VVLRAFLCAQWDSGRKRWSPLDEAINEMNGGGGQRQLDSGFGTGVEQIGSSDSERSSLFGQFIILFSRPGYSEYV
jgi:hypothetical protein